MSKILAFVAQPLVWVIVLTILAFTLRKRKSGRVLTWTAILIFFIFSNHILVTEVLKRWEGNNTVLRYDHYDAVVVLGGYSNWNSRHNSAQFSEGSDRIIRSLELYKKGRVSKIVLSGGSGLLMKPEEKESYWVKEILISLGVDEADILIEGESRNTHENAQYTSRLLRSEIGENGRYLLVTSAFHMNRAERCFRKYSLNFDYHRVDFCADDSDYDLGSYIIPTAGALSGWQFLIKEMLGYTVYSFSGYF